MVIRKDWVMYILSLDISVMHMYHGQTLDSLKAQAATYSEVGG